MDDKQGRKDKILQYKERKVTGCIYVIKNTITNKVLLLTSADLKGCKNRFEFAQKTGSCVHPKLSDDWKEHGENAFVLEILEQLDKKEDQTNKEFADDLKVLEELWLEKIDSNLLY